MMIHFSHGALADSYENQANKQGFTLGNNAELFQELGHGLIMNHMHGILNDYDYDKALQKLHKKLIKNLKRMDK